MITRLKLSTIEQGLPKYRSMLAGNTAYNPYAFESIATVTGNGSATSLTFSSIPSTYQHLQIRGISKITPTAQESSTLRLQINGDTAANYANHTLRGDGSSVLVTGQTARSYINTTDTNAASMTSPTNMTNIFGVSIWDIHDYASTTKNKTVRFFAGLDANVASTSIEINIGSGLWLSTSAITSISMVASDPFTTTTTFALYGIKGA